MLLEIMMMIIIIILILPDDSVTQLVHHLLQPDVLQALKSVKDNYLKLGVK